MRKTQLDTLTRTQTMEQVQAGGAFARASSELQAQILAASQRFKTVPPDILAGMLEQEGGFYNTGPTRILRNGRPASTAWGRGQITDGAEKDIRGIPGMEGFDKYNVDTQVMGAAAYLSLRQQWAGGDMIKALDGYGTGPGYGLNVYRRSGRLGDTSSLAQAKDQDANARAIAAANENLKSNTELYGRNGLQLDAQTRANQALGDQVARGVPLTDALRDSITSFSTQAATAAQQLKLVQFVRDTEFEREQLGRTGPQARAYALARARVGDTTSGAAQQIIQESQNVSELYEAKAAVTDAMGGFVTDLRRGTDAANAFGSMLGRLADRALNSLTDTVVSSLFSAGSKSGGAGGGGLGGIFNSIGSFFGFANGGIMGPNGPLPLRAYSAGGIADSPQLALYGEGKMPEAYVPLPDGRRIPVAMQGGGAANSNGGPVSITHAPTYNVTPANGVTPEQLAAVVDQNNRQFAASLPGRVRDIQRRYG